MEGGANNDCGCDPDNDKDNDYKDNNSDCDSDDDDDDDDDNDNYGDNNFPISGHIWPSSSSQNSDIGRWSFWSPRHCNWR